MNIEHTTIYIFANSTLNPFKIVMCKPCSDEMIYFSENSKKIQKMYVKIHIMRKKN